MCCKTQSYNWQLQLNQTGLLACNCSTGQRQQERSQLSLQTQCRNKKKCLKWLALMHAERRFFIQNVTQEKLISEMFMIGQEVVNSGDSDDHVAYVWLLLMMMFCCLPPTKEAVHVFARVCLSVCLSVSKITQKRVHGFGWNVTCRQMSGHGRTD